MSRKYFIAALKSWKVKRLIALSLLALCLAGCKSIGELASTVDTALYEVTEAVSNVDTVTGERSLSLSTRTSEISQAESALNRIVANPTTVGASAGARQVAPTDRRYRRLARILNRVVSVSHATEEMHKSVEFVYFDDPLENAFALGGNKMVFFTGFTEDVDDDELAFVNGHEMAHNTASHLSEALAARLLVELAGGDTDRAGWGEAHTLKQEEEADKLGILYATLAGFDPYAASRFWSRQVDDGYRYFRTHPTGPERALRTREIADRVVQYHLKGRENPKAQAILACNVLYCRRGEMLLEPGKGGGLLTMLTAAANAYVRQEETKQEIARQEAEIATHRTRDDGSDNYAGEYRDGKAHGFGIMTWANGDRYEGEWRAGARHGRGTMTWVEGDRYEGEFRNDLLNGLGTYFLVDGDRYEGEFSDDLFHGRGTYIWANGDRYEGEFQDDLFHGRGTYIWADGDSETCTWRHDESVEGTCVSD